MPHGPLGPLERQRRGDMSKWKQRPDGSWEPPELVDRFLNEWCLVPPNLRPQQQQWAEENGVSPRTVSSWKKDERFREEWNRRLGATWTHPDKIGPIINSLIETAEGGGPQAVRAAEVFLKFVGMMKPPELNVNVKVPTDLSQLSDAELVQLVRADEEEAQWQEDAPELGAYTYE